MSQEPYSITAQELAAHGFKDIPAPLRSTEHLIYSSPATLAFNSPGAQGFGVKRAGLSVPGSVMLLVAPGCCGRNTTLLSERKEYDGRFFFLLMDETDIVTGRHLKKIPGAVKEVVDSLETPPSAVMICITCVDALLGTDMERVCKKSREAAGVPVLPCYMYALTREGRVSPMVAVRKTIFSLLEKRKKKGTSVHLMGEFTPFSEDTELYDVLRSMGVKTIHEIARCRTYEEYQAISESNFNLVVHPEARLAAEDMRKRLEIPSIELTRLYQLDKIHRQYELLAAAVGAQVDDAAWQRDAEEAVSAFRKACPDAVFAVGEWMNGDPFELSLALLRYGFAVSEIFGTLTQANWIYVKKIALLSPGTRVYSNLSPDMLYYDCAREHADFVIGKDAAYYHPDGTLVPWNEEELPFGYQGLRALFEQLLRAAQGEPVREGGVRG